MLFEKEKKSAVAGILDKNGGLRVVVTQRWRMRAHIKKGERLFVLPNFFVQEPVPWGIEQANLIKRVEAYVQSKVAPTNACGECRACCKTMYIKEDGFEKASHTWCKNCTNTGCGIYPTRPKPCRTFECSWLKSQTTENPMAEGLRPDTSGVIFTADTDGDPSVFECHVDHMTEDAKAFIDSEQATGKKAKLVTHYNGEAES